MSTASIYQRIRKSLARWLQYRRTTRIWVRWWQDRPDYGMATNSAKHVARSRRIVDRYASVFAGCTSLCELGVGTGRNLHYFHERFPDWHYSGNDIAPGIHGTIASVYPELLQYAEILVADSLEYLKSCDSADILFTHGHLMHLPDAVIDQVFAMMADKADRFILLHEAYPHKPGSPVKSSYKRYRFERDYEGMFPGFLLKDKEIEEDPGKQGLRHCLYLFEKADG
jgi:hypothetical protein